MPDWFGILVGMALLASLVWGVRRWRSRSPLPQVQAFSFREPGATYSGIRYPRPGSPPVLLIHGYGGNSRNWKEMGHLLHRKGFDVWMANLRGHGLGHQRSTSHQGVYGFRYIVTEDIPLLVEHVVKQTARKVYLVGHSLGGVASLAYAGGVREGADGLMVDEGQARHLASRRLEALVCIGSPPHFHAFPRSLGWIVSRPASLIETLQKALLWSAPAPSPGKASRSSFKGLRGQLLGRIDRSLQKRNPMRGVVEVGNFDVERGEFQRLLDKGLSPVPKDLTRDVNRWVRSGEILSEEGLNYVSPRRIEVPVLFISGELDLLGPPEEIHSQAQALRGMARVWELHVPGTSHVDLISGRRAARLTGEYLCRFLNRPSALGDSGTRVVIPAESSSKAS